MQNIENNEIVSKGFIQATSFEESSDVFSSFLTKSAESQFNGAVSFHDITSFFPKVGCNNALRKYCLHVLTDSSSVEIPRVQDIVSGLDGDKVEANISRPIRIELSEAYAKWLIPKSLFHKIEGYQEYLKSIFSDNITALENKVLSLFVKGLNFQFVRDEDHILNDNSIFTVEFDEKQTFVEHLLLLKSQLPARYLSTAVFFMSKKFLSYFYSQKDVDGRYVYDGENKIFGHQVVFIDELENKILFGDFKQAIVLAEKLYPKIEMHSKFENPNQVGLSMPVSVGFGLINNQAIVGLNLNDENLIALSKKKTTDNKYEENLTNDESNN